MATQVLYLKWRPITFDEVVGQEHVTYTLRNALVSGRVGHAYLFSGPRGTGKTTMARLLAKSVNCLHEDPAKRPCNQCQHCASVNAGRFLDLIEIDAASHTGVDDVRELRERIAFAPNEGRYKVYIIDEVHRFSGAAFDALLKTIEEPPAHAIFVLATTEIHKVPQTILSRCQRFDFRRIPLHQIVERLWMLVEAEGIQAEEAALELIARQGTGSLRDAISLLDQLISEPGEVLTLEQTQAILGTVANQAVQDLTATLISGDTATGLDLINRVLDEGADARQFARQMVEYLRLVMLVQTGGFALAESVVSPDVSATITEQAERFPRRGLLNALRAFNEAAASSQVGWQPQLPLELALVESVEASHAPSSETVPLASPQAGRLEPSPPITQVQPVRASSHSNTEPPPQDAPTKADIHERWSEVHKATREFDLTAQALLNSSTLYGVEGYTVILQVESDTLRDKIEGEHNRSVIEAAFRQVFQLPLSIHCRVRSTSVSQQSREVEELLAHDDLAAFAVNELGGVVSHVEDHEENMS